LELAAASWAEFRQGRGTNRVLGRAISPLIVLDVNILFYSYSKASPQYEKARSCVEKLFSGAEQVGLPWQTITAFLRISTNPRLPGARSAAEAVQEVENWLAQPCVQIITSGDDHWQLLRAMIFEGQAFGPLVSDAQIAALTVEHGAVLYSTDRDFARFPGLRWVNPLS
jgi:toxin-antitoxin system PIN domain toxin